MTALDDPALLSAVFALIGGIIGSVLTYVGVLKDVQSKYNTELHKERITAYSDVWNKFEPFADYSKGEKVTLAELEKLSRELTKCYYGKAGLVMSRNRQRKYLNVIKVIDKTITSKYLDVSASPSPLSPATIYLTDEQFNSMFKVASTFRTSLSRDVGSRIFIFRREVSDVDIDDGVQKSSSGTNKVDEEDERKSRYRACKP